VKKDMLSYQKCPDMTKQRGDTAMSEVTQASDTLEYIGTLSKTKGFRGDMIVKDLQKGIQTIESGSEILVGFSKNFAKKQILKKFSTRGQYPVMCFRGFESDVKAQQFIEKAVFTDRSNINVESHGQPTLTEDIIGTEVFASEEELIGVIVDIFYTPANEVWVIEREEGNDITFPAVADFILRHDYQNKKVWVSMPDGLDEI
jgi:16S rRNA processing protein RimM